jgi:hypothetical protein
MPVYVSSGTGAHVYWSLTENLDPATWLTYAQGLRAACQQLGLHADAARTCEIASILRPAGTHNRKIEPRLVTCGPLVGPYPLEQFTELLKYEPRQHTGKTSTAALAQRIAPHFEGPPRSGRTIAAACGQLKQLCEARGRISEPLRHACFGVLAFCEDGKEIALQNNERKRHPAYTADEIEDKFRRYDKLTGATTCERFHTLNPKTCKACPHWQKIKSPISLACRSGAEHQRPPADKPRLLIEDCNPDCTVAALRDILAPGRHPHTPSP